MKTNLKNKKNRTITLLIVLDDNNTPNHCEINIGRYGNKYYYNGKEISEIAHTHSNSSSPSQQDQETAIIIPTARGQFFIMEHSTPINT
ncbi:MAG: hypothetical protein LBG28_12050 [Tannerella sp.]|jgi:cyclophilin family peptidyl-prolyl cis-trans isomerase|nr:hypothetical protein [Tannerella sp.]